MKMVRIMNELFLMFLDRTIIGSYVIAIVLVFRYFLKKIPKRFSYLLWIVAFLTLCLPIQFQSGYSLQPDLNGVKPSILMERMKIQEAMESMPSDFQENAHAEESSIIESDDPIDTSVLLLNPSIDWVDVAGSIWFCVLLATVVFHLLRLLYLKRSLANAVFAEDNIFFTDRKDAPFVFGLFHPRIYIPQGLDEDTLQCVIAHERVHIRRHDLWFKVFAFFIVCIHWFNPIVHFAYRCMIKDMEMSCDETVVAENHISPYRYAHALLNITEHAHSIYSMQTFAQGNVKQRIQHIMTYHRFGTGVTLVILLLILCVSIGLFAMPTSSSHALSNTSEGLQQIFAHSIQDKEDYDEILAYLDFSPYYAWNNQDITKGESSTEETITERSISVKLNVNKGMNIQNITDFPNEVLMYNAGVLFALDPLLHQIEYEITKDGQVYTIAYSMAEDLFDRSHYKDTIAYANTVNTIYQKFLAQDDAYMDKKAVFEGLQEIMPAKYKNQLNRMTTNLISEDESVCSYSIDLKQLNGSYENSRVDLSFCDEGLHSYRWKYYDIYADSDIVLDEKAAQQLVNQFVAIFRKDEKDLSFTKQDLTENHLYLKGHFETWTAQGNNGTSVIVVDLKKGAIAEAVFR